MARPTTSARRRNFAILRLFFSLVLGLVIQIVRARITGRSYDFFNDSVRNRKRAIRIRETALRLGGVLIKVGQFLSSRVDLLPSEYIEELALLQDEVPGVPYEEIALEIQRELGAPVEHLFRSFDREPVAAASLGQVHAATLPTGQHVAVKVQRPGIEAIVETDLRSISFIVHWLHRYTFLGKRADLPQILREFIDTLRLELDYHAEGHHAERLGVLFADTPQIAIPRVYWSYSAGRVLTLQYMTGVKVTDFASLERSGISRTLVAEILMRAYLRQVLQFGFFHADPHPGNIFVRPGPVVVLLDFGMVGEITTNMRENIRTVFLGIMRRDYDQVILALKRLGFFTRHADTQAIRRALAWTVENFIDLSFGELRSVNPQLVIDQLQDVLFTESFQIPAYYAFLGRALGTLSGLCTALDPSFQFVTVAEPYARELVAREAGWRGLVHAAREEAQVLAGTLYRLPVRAEHLLQDVETGELNVRNQFSTVVHELERLERGTRRVVEGMFVVGFLIAGMLTYTRHFTVIAYICFALAFVFVVRLFVPIPRLR